MEFYYIPKEFNKGLPGLLQKKPFTLQHEKLILQIHSYFLQS